MKIRRYLTVSSSGSTKVYKKRPGLAYDEVCIALDLELPNQLFAKPQLAASITIPPEAAAPAEIESEVVEEIAEAVKNATGIDVKITVVDPEDA